MPDLLRAFALVAAGLMLSGLVSGVVHRAPFSVPMIFLGLGLVLGEGGLDVLRVDVHDRTLEIMAILSLAFVLFLDAITLRLDKRERVWRVLLLALGPGTLLTVGLIAVGARLIFGTSWLESLLLGSVLASIDPVVLRDVVRDERVPAPIRQELTTEAGANDIIVLPLVLILSAIMRGQTAETLDSVLPGSSLMALVTAALHERTMMGIEPAIGPSNRSTGGPVPGSDREVGPPLSGHGVPSIAVSPVPSTTMPCS